MDLVEVNIIRAETPKAIVDLSEDGFARQALAIWARPHAPEDPGQK